MKECDSTCETNLLFLTLIGCGALVFSVEVDLDAEFDPDKYDQEMQQRFDDEYYAQPVCIHEEFPIVCG